MVTLDRLTRVPWFLLAPMAAALAACPAPVFARPVEAAAIQAAFAVADLLLLTGLRRFGVSFGPTRPCWLIFSFGRALLGVTVGLLAREPSAALGILTSLQGVLLLLAAYGSAVEPYLIEHTHLSVPAPGLTHPLRLLFFSDLHLERLTRRELSVLASASEERPDLILLGGDLLNLSYLDDPRTIEDARVFLSRLTAPAGVFAVRGTEEVDSLELVQRLLDGHEITLLDGARAAIAHGETTLNVVGIPADARPEALIAQLDQLTRDTSGPVICLHHTPDLLEEAARLGVHLYLAGHTHGGQICLPVLGPLITASRFGRRYARGHHVVGTTHAYITRGLGLEGLGAPRMRFLARPELVWITLTPAQAPALEDAPAVAKKVPGQAA